MLDLIAPRSCLVCGRPLVDASYREPAICRSCLGEISPLESPNPCPGCGIPIARFLTRCERCRRESFCFDRVLPVQRYTGVCASIVQQYKFRGHFSLARTIAQAIVPIALRFDPSSSIIVPAPSTRRSVRRRGFSSAGLIARELARRTGTACVPVLRARSRSSQKSLSYEERRRNAARAISISGTVPPQTHVLLVDDVFTTGTTADACARRLKEAGADEVTVLVFGLEY
ncbi:MAG: ComF family protein [Spirochaetota bacterium]